MKNSKVAVFKTEYCVYPTIAPFNPNKLYPEYPFKVIEENEVNVVYEGVRETFKLLNLDKENYNKKNWNPLGFLIKPNDTVVLKPNLIKESTDYDSEKWEFVITHGSIIRAVIDYVYIALKGKGRIVILEGPQTDSDMQMIIKRTKIDEIIKFYEKEKGFKIEFYDIRKESWKTQNGIIISKEKLPGDPEGYIVFDLKEKSLFSYVDFLKRNYYGAYYDIEETNRHHITGKHEYMIPKTAISADVLINLPKVKTHKKAGITANLKNLIGLTEKRNWIPHYAFGSPLQNGDQFKDVNTLKIFENIIVKNVKRLIKSNNQITNYIFSIFKIKNLGYKLFGKTSEVLRSGNWYGNDTIWRAIIDINRIILYGETNGTINPLKVKRTFSVVDGIIGMEGNGPVEGTPFNSGIIVAGTNFLTTDLVVTKLMGFDYNKIKTLYNAMTFKELPLSKIDYGEIEVISNKKEYDKKLIYIEKESVLKFKPSSGWKNFIEL